MLQRNILIQISKHLIIFLLFVIMNSIASAQEKTIEVRIPNEIADSGIKNFEDWKNLETKVVKITLDNEGFISSIVPDSYKGVPDPKIIKITKQKDYIEIKENRNKKNYISKLEWNGKVLKLYGLIYSKVLDSNAFREIRIGDDKIIYDSKEVTLEKNGDQLNEKLNVQQIMDVYFNYQDNVLYDYYRFKNNISVKFVFKKNGESISATLLKSVGDTSFDESGTIEISGAEIHSKSNLINTINYFILKNSYLYLEDVLFPLIFNGSSTIK